MGEDNYTIRDLCLSYIPYMINTKKHKKNNLSALKGRWGLVHAQVEHTEQSGPLWRKVVYLL